MFSIFRDADQLENVEQQLLEMLTGCQDTFRLATAAVFGEADVEETGRQLGSTDSELNKTERAVRRELLVHGTVRGADVDQGLMLMYMSVAKDLERIGDYCKNVWNLAQMGVNLSGGDDNEELQKHRNRVAELIELTLEAFGSQDVDAVHALIPGIKEDTQHYDEQLSRLVNSDLPARYAVPRALFYRYIKRISAHLSNTLSSVVMPVDRLDFYKESKAIEPATDSD